ncbi:MAG: hypothetical protein ACLQU3_33370 [Limisphaerales bacterium]
MKTSTITKAAAPALLLIAWLVLPQAAHCFYNPSTGRWISRDPLGDESFLKPHTLGDIATEQVLRQEALKPPFLFPQNNPISSIDPLGLCPPGTCDKWQIYVVNVDSGGVALGVLWVKSELRADPSCCMGGPLDYNRDYVYLGVGLGVGLNISVSIDVGSKWFKTPYIKWADHNGWGRVTADGIGVIYTYGTLFLTTPQTYLNITSPSWGIDVSIVTTIGRWRIQPNSYQQ